MCVGGGKGKGQMNRNDVMNYVCCCTLYTVCVSLSIDPYNPETKEKTCKQKEKKKKQRFAFANSVVHALVPDPCASERQCLLA